MAICRGRHGKPGCGREIEWAIVEASGARMPIDPYPRDEGNVVKIGTTDAESGASFIRVLTKGEDYTGPRYTSHFVTCPHADANRR